MVRTNEPWLVGDPELNDCGIPIIQNIAERLGCMRFSTDPLCIKYGEDCSPSPERKRSSCAYTPDSGIIDASASGDQSNCSSAQESEQGNSTGADSVSSPEAGYFTHYDSQVSWSQAMGLRNSSELCLEMAPSNPNITIPFNPIQQVVDFDSPAYDDLFTVGATCHF